MNWTTATVQLYAAMFRERYNFAQASYGDGEFKCILGIPLPNNANGEPIYPELGYALAATIHNPNGQWCEMWPQGTTARDINAKAQAWVAKYGGNVSWVASRPLARAGADAAEALQALRKRRVVLVGPDHLADVPKCVLDPVEHVTVDKHAASRGWERTVGELLPIVEPDDVVLIAAGTAANLIVHRLAGIFGRQLTAFDVGAMFDPYAGVMSRNSHRGQEAVRDELMRRMR